MAYIDGLCEQLKIPSDIPSMRLYVAASCLYVYGTQAFVKKGFMDGQKAMRVYQRLAEGYNPFEWDAAVMNIKNDPKGFGKFMIERLEVSGDYWDDYVIRYCKRNDIAGEEKESEFFTDFIATIPFIINDDIKDVLAACLFTAIRDNQLHRLYTGDLEQGAVLPTCKDILMRGRNKMIFDIAEIANEYASDLCDKLAENTGKAEYKDLYDSYIFPYLRKNAILPGMLLNC